MTAETMPLFDIPRTPADPLGAAIREIVPGAGWLQVEKLKSLIAAEAERIARPPKQAGAFR